MMAGDGYDGLPLDAWTIEGSPHFIPHCYGCRTEGAAAGRSFVGLSGIGRRFRSTLGQGRVGRWDEEPAARPWLPRSRMKPADAVVPTPIVEPERESAYLVTAGVAAAHAEAAIFRIRLAAAGCFGSKQPCRRRLIRSTAGGQPTIYFSIFRRIVEGRGSHRILIRELRHEDLRSVRRLTGNREARQRSTMTSEPAGSSEDAPSTD